MSEKVNLKARDISLDVMKGFAMLLVIMQHSARQIVDSNWIGLILMDVPLFFLVSGFLAYKPEINIASMMTKKVRYILIPFVCAVIFTAIYSGLSILDIISKIDKCGYWFLQSLFIIFMVYCLICKSFKKIKYWVPLTIIIEILLLAASKFSPETIDNYIGFSSLCRYFPCFICGVVIRKYSYRMSVPNIWLLTCYLLIAIIPFLSLKIPKDLVFLASVLSYSAGAIILYYFIKSILGKLPQFLIGILTTIGKYSIVVYLIHFFLIPRIPIVDSLNATIMIIPSIIIAVIIAYICILISKLLTFATPLKYILPE